MAENVARALEADGFSVWWDRNIHGGADFSAAIDRELAAARAVVVLWSPHSVASEWVRDEAGQARDDGKLVPLRVGGARPPLGFRQRQAIDLSGWSGDHKAAAFVELAASVRAIMDASSGASSTPAAPPPTRARALAGLRRRGPLIVAGAAALAAAVGIAAFALRDAGGAHNGRVAVATIRTLTDEAGAFSSGLAAALLREFADAGVAAGAPAQPAAAEFRMTGAVGREAGKFVVDMQVETAKDRVLWSQRFRQGETAEGEFQEFAARRAAGSLACALRKRTKAGVAIDDAIFGLFIIICAADDADDFPAQHAAATRLARAAPKLSLAHSELALAADFMSWSTSSDAEHARFVDESRREAQAALALDPKNGMAHFALGETLLDVADWPEGKAHYIKAAEYEPDEPRTLLVLALHARAVGRLAEAADLVARGAGLFPDEPLFVQMKALFAAMRGDMVAARRAFKQARALDPAIDAGWENQVEFLYGDAAEAQTYVASRFAAGALERKEAACFDSFARARAEGRPSAAEAIAPCVESAGFGHRARMFAALGDLDGAFAQAEQNWALGVGELDTMFLFYPEMRAFRRDARFWPLVARMGLANYWLETGEWPDFCAEPGLPYDCEAAAKTAVAALEAPAAPSDEGGVKAPN